MDFTKQVNGHLHQASGQTFLESMLLMPLFLLLVFALLQVGHLGVAIAIVNYAASSAARQAVLENTTTASSVVQGKFRTLLSAGLKYKSLTSSSPDNDTVAPNVEVIGCAELAAYPFVGIFLDKAISGHGSGNDCDSSAKSLGPVALKRPSPYQFVIESKVIARMNYKTAN